MAQFLHIPVMAAGSISSRCDAHRLEPVIGDSGAPRRRREDAAPRCQPAGRVPRSSGQVEAARTSRRSRIDALKDRVFRILHKALGVTFFVLLSGIAATALDIWPGQRRFGVPLIFAGLVMTVACWALFLCTCSQRSRDFLEAFLVPSSLGDEWKKRGAASRAKPTTGDPWQRHPRGAGNMTAARAWTSSTTAVGCLLLALLLALTPGVEPRMDCESYCILTGYRYSIGPCRCYESGTRSSWHQLLSTSSYRSQDPYGVVYRGPHPVDVAMTSPWVPPVFGSPKPYYWPDSDYWFYR